jgi:hypothetical protein
VDDEAGDGDAEVWRVYADREDALPKRFEATASIFNGNAGVTIYERARMRSQHIPAGDHCEYPHHCGGHYHISAYS